MKTKEFNKVKPYTYLIIRKSDNKKYHGLRIRNTRLGLSPLNDLGIKYFSSGVWQNECQKNPQKFIFIIKHTFDTISEVSLYEKKINKILIRKDQWKNWVNKSAFPHIILSAESRKILSQKTSARVSGKGNPMFQKTHTPEAKRKISRVSKITMSKLEMKLKLLKGRLNSGYRHSEYTKNKMRESQLGSKSHRYGKAPVNKGKRMSIEQRIKISKAKKGKKTGPPSEEHRRKISEAKKGIRRSEETKRKISLAKTGKKLSIYHRLRLSEGQLGRKHSSFMKTKMSQIAKRIKKGGKHVQNI